MYIKSTYDGLHVITGTTEGVSHVIFFLLVAGRLLFPNPDPHIGFQWDDTGLPAPNHFIASEVTFVGLLVVSDTKRSITSDRFTAPPFLSVCSV